MKKIAFIGVLLLSVAGCSKSVAPGMPSVEIVTPSPAVSVPPAQKRDMAEQGETAKQNAQHLADKEKPERKD